MTDSRARLRYLDEVVPLLFPPAGPAPHAPRAPEATGRGDQDRHRAYALVPSRFLPRRLTPRARWLPGRRRLPRHPGTIESHLGEVFGRRIGVTMHVRPARRANRKPILEVHAATGERLAYVKIGDSERARALVRHESATLELLAGLPLKSVAVPSVLYHGVWNGLEVLVLSPLPVRRGRVPRPLLDRAVAEIARLGVPGGRPGPGASAGAGGHCWHGDFAPWNMAPAADGRLLVWDWERFATDVPLGFDALHHFFQRALRRMSPEVAARSCLAQSTRTLEPFGLSAGQARETAVHYLIALAYRHEADGHHPLGPPSRWLTPLADQQEVLR